MLHCNLITELPREIRLEIFKYIYVDYKIMELENYWNINDLLDFIDVDEIINIYSFWRLKYKIKTDELIWHFKYFTIVEATKEDLHKYLIDSLHKMKLICSEKIATYKIYNDIIETALRYENQQAEYMYILEDDFH
tara:strand:+ start:26 stop:433 length:408 start_codon:yes stop_codon:yes gene_type:complete